MSRGPLENVNTQAKRILVVEDHHGWQELLKRQIESALSEILQPGQILVTANSADACKVLNDQPGLHLAVTDIGLDEGAFLSGQKLGMEVVIRARDNNVPCIVVSGTVSPGDVNIIITQHKARAFFDKAPFNFDGFKSEVKNILIGSLTPPLPPPVGMPTLVYPIFQTRKTDVIQDRVFVLMPFTQPWSEMVWKKLLEPTCRSLRLDSTRADELYGQDIMETVWKGICAARIIIADVTGRNPNVLYELGIAHTVGKKFVLIAQNEEDIPFDLRRYRHIIYKDDSDGHRALRKEIKNSLRAILDEEGSGS